MLPLASHGEYADETDKQTDGQMTDRYIWLVASLAEASVIIYIYKASTQTFYTLHLTIRKQWYRCK